MIVQRRGKNVAIAGSVLQGTLAVAMLIIWRVTGSVSAMAATWFLAAGVPMWLMAAFMLYCRQLQKREAMEGEQLAGEPTSAIFERQGDDVNPAGRRVAFVERWISPIFTMVLAAAELTIAIAMFHYLSGRGEHLPEQALSGAVFTILAGFAAFLFSRYSVGMSERAEWRLLRATGSYLTMNVVSMFAVVLAFGCMYVVASSPSGANTILQKADSAAAYVICAFQVVLAAELLLNFILDLYRPRLPGQEQRASFDSRLFNLVAQPGRVGHSLAEAINYQFGFEVSKSWFYQLVVKALVPLLIFGALVLVAMSGVVVVENGQQALVLHWGRIQDKPLSAGMHFKWPWPVDTVQMYPTDRVQSFTLGVGEARSYEKRRELGAVVEKPSAYFARELFLWKDDHGPAEEKNFVVAAAPRDPKAPQQNLIKLVVNVQYAISNLPGFVRFNDGAKMLECISSHQLVLYCASATLESSVGQGDERPEAIMTFGRSKAADELKRRIQKAADEQLGGGVVDIRLVGIQAVHPPKEVVPDDEKVLEAERRQAIARYSAQSEANQKLSEVAGDTMTARLLALAIRKAEDLELLREQAGTPAFAVKMDEVLARLKGDIAAESKEIAQDRLMGRLNIELPAASEPSTAPFAQVDQLTLQQRMLQEYQDYLRLLEGLNARASAATELKKALEEQVAKSNSEADTLLRGALGKPATIVAQAQSKRWSQELSERAAAESFQSHLMAYRASPKVYMLDRWLEVWDDVLPRVPKYVFCADPDKFEVRLNLEMRPGAMSGVTFGETSSGAKPNK